jgi:hypothetical protein
MAMKQSILGRCPLEEASEIRAEALRLRRSARELAMNSDKERLLHQANEMEERAGQLESRAMSGRS